MLSAFCALFNCLRSCNAGSVFTLTLIAPGSDIYVAILFTFLLFFLFLLFLYGFYEILNNEINV